MKFRNMATLALCGVLSLAASPVLAAKERPVRLTMTTQYMDRHPVVQKVFKPWIEEVKKRTGGRVLITLYNPNTLCPEGEILDAVLKGQVDIGQHFCARNPGRMPLNTVIGKIPMTVSSYQAGALGYWNLWHDSPELQAEYKGLHVLGLHTTAACQVHTKNKPVATLDDLASLRLLGASKDTMVIINALGLNGIMQPMTDMYLAMSRNMGDAAMVPVATLRSYKINESTKHTLLFHGIMGSCWFAMNEAKWNSLPPDVQQVLTETTGEAISMALGRALDDGEKEDRVLLEKEGHTFSDLAPDERMRWRERIQPALKASWLEEIEKSGLADPDALYAKATEAMERAETALTGKQGG